MAQHGPVPTRKNGSSEESFPPYVAVSDGVDALMDGVEPAGAHPMPDSAGAEATFPQLRVRRHPMLIRGEIRHPDIRCRP
jgi:hypothetical protein